MAKQELYTDDVMKITGFAHLVFGFIILAHQAGSALASWAYMNNNMFEDAFQPGIWLGLPILLLGVACLYQYKFPREALHTTIVAFTIAILALCVFFMVFKVRFIIRDPEAMTFVDCSAPRWPKSFILDDKPHCNAQKLNNSFGQSMLAFATADIIVCIVGLVFLCRTTYQFDRVRYLSPVNRDNTV